MKSKRTRIRLVLLFVTIAGCGHPSGGRTPTQFARISASLWYPCTQDSDCQAYIPSGFDGYMCMSGVCAFYPKAGTKCSPPDVSYCEMPNGGSHPDCIELADGGMPVNREKCGTAQCVSSNEGASAVWGPCKNKDP
jgi:hypothetical protein